MRDTLRLRSHLALLACLPALASACQEPPTSSTAAADREPDRNRATPSQAADARSSRPAEPGADASPASEPRDAPPQPRPEDARFLPIPGDPPYIDGYNPEEETCVSGNWCGTIETALAVAPNADSTPKEMDCPVRIVGAHDPSPIRGPAYQGLSAAPNMQGALNQHGTELARAGGKADACCYHWFEYCSGRPLLHDGRQHVAPLRDGSCWLQPNADRPTPAALALRTRQALAQAWLDDALAEHASVAAFARVTLELMAVGAPPELLAATTRAGLDEIDHARRCFTIASRLSGRTHEPGPLPSPPPRPASLVAVAVDTFVEGCVGETVATLVAERALADTREPEIRELLEVTRRDEARHAALAWRTLAWALDRGGAEVAEALHHAANALVDRQVAPSPAPWEADPMWRAHGRLPAAAMARARRDAIAEIVLPMLERLLTAPDRITCA